MSTSTVNWHEFDGSGALAAGLAEAVAERLSTAIGERGRATLVVSGGTTPALFFDHLSRQAIEWQAVAITLVDERFVPPSSQRSNERLVRERLLVGPAAAAHFIGLWRDAPDAEAAAIEATVDLSALPLPFDVVVLGMGADGHTASLFPDADNLAQLLDPAAPPAIYAVHAPDAGEARLTWPLGVLAAAGALYLHIEGAEKRAMLAAAVGAASDQALPVAAVLRAAVHPTEIFWAPREGADS